MTKTEMAKEIQGILRNLDDALSESERRTYERNFKNLVEDFIVKIEESIEESIEEEEQEFSEEDEGAFGIGNVMEGE